MMRMSLVGISFILLAACNGSPKSTPINKSLPGGPNSSGPGASSTSNTDEKTLNTILTGASSCLPLDQEVASLLGRTNTSVTVFTSDLEAVIPGANAAMAPTAVDNVTNGKLLNQLKNHFVMYIVAGADLFITSPVSNLLNVVTQTGCDQVQFKASIDGGAGETFVKTTPKPTTDKPQISGAAVNPHQLNLVNTQTGEQRYYRDDGNGNLVITVLRPITIAGACTTATGLMVQEKFVVMHGAQNSFRLGMGFANLLATTLAAPPKNLVLQLNSAAAQANTSGNGLTRVPSISSVQVSNDDYPLLANAVQEGKFNTLTCK